MRGNFLKQLYNAFEPIIPIFIMIFVIVIIAFLFFNKKSGHPLNSRRRQFTLLNYVGMTATVVGMVLVTLMPTGYNNDMVQLVPFQSIIETWELATTRAIINSLLLNVLLFVPFGFFLYLLTRKEFFTTIMACITSILIEVMQYVLPIGRVTNIDDVILNTIGGIIGMLIGVIVLKLEMVYSVFIRGNDKDK
jgi:glycopeptide antibiotics resistance protein